MKGERLRRGNTRAKSLGDFVVVTLLVKQQNKMKSHKLQMLGMAGYSALKDLVFPWGFFAFAWFS